MLIYVLHTVTVYIGVCCRDILRDYRMCKNIIFDGHERKQEIRKFWNFAGPRFKKQNRQSIISLKFYSSLIRM